MSKNVVSLLVTTALAVATFMQPALSAESSRTEANAGKQSPPPALPPRPLQLPKPTSYKLPNGLTVVLLEDHRVPFVSFQLGIKAGDAADPKELPGLATVVADMITEGTNKRTSKEIAGDVDSIGGALKASADPDFTIISGSALSQYQDKFFSIVADVLLHPSFPDDELKLEKTNLIEQLTMKRTQPDFLADERFHKVVFGDNPYAVVAPTKESVEKVTREQLLAFHKAHYLPNVSALVVVGDFKMDEMKKSIESNFGQWQRGSTTASVSGQPPAQKGRIIYLIDRPGSVQSSVKIGNVAISKTDPDYFAAMVANQILGGSANSRLFLNIREQKGYTYGAYSSFYPRKNPGEFYAKADVRTPVTAPSIMEFLYELNRIRTLPVSQTELESAKNYLIGTFQTGFETQGAVGQRLLEMQLYDLPADYLENYTNNILAVNPDDVRRVARKHIDVNNLVITVVGDAKQIEPELQFFAPVEVYDQTGKLVRKDDEKTSRG
jgi:zinc protease